MARPAKTFTHDGDDWQAMVTWGCVSRAGYTIGVLFLPVQVGFPPEDDGRSLSSSVPFLLNNFGGGSPVHGRVSRYVPTGEPTCITFPSRTPSARRVRQRALSKMPAGHVVSQLSDHGAHHLHLDELRIHMV